MTPKRKELPYVEGEFEFEGVKYKSTELPFEGDFIPLEFSLPATKTSEAYAAQLVAQKTNFKMEKEVVNQSPTYPIKNNDLIWFAIVNARGSYQTNFADTPMRQVCGPYLVRNQNNRFTAYTPKGILQKMLGDIVPISENNDISSVDVRLFRHIDRQETVGLTYAFERDEADSSYAVDNDSNDALEAIEPIKSIVEDGIDLEGHIQETLQEESLKDITERHRKDN